MKKWKGSLTNSSIQKSMLSGSKHLFIQGYGITNMSGTPVTVNIQLEQDESFVQISPVNLQLAVGDSFAGDGISLDPGESFVLSVTGGTIDYYIIYTEA